MESRLDNGMATMSFPASLEGTVRALCALGPQDLEAASGLILKLARREGFEASPTVPPIACPEEGLTAWATRLRMEGYSDVTISSYRSAVASLLRDRPAPTRLDVQGWISRRLEERSAATASMSRKAARSLFGFLFTEGLWPVDPTARLGGIKGDSLPKAAPSVDEVATVMSYRCRAREDAERFRCLTALLATTGLRVSEGVGLRKDCVHAERGELVTLGKGKKAGVVPFVPSMAAALKDFMTARPSASPFVFPSAESRSGHWNKGSYERTFRAACLSLGLPPYTPHSLRHFYATHMLKSGAKIEVVSRILRHSSISTTVDVYRHVRTEEMHEAVAMHAPLELACR